MNQEQLNKDLEVFSNRTQGISKLKAWIAKYLSQDIVAAGDLESYAQYLSYAKWVVNEWLPETKQPEGFFSAPFEEKNIFCLAAMKGLDRFFANNFAIKSYINKENTHHMTPLHLAASSGHVHTVDNLIALGANASKPNRNGQLPIHCALFIPMLHQLSLVDRKIEIFNALFNHAPNTLEVLDSSNDSLLHMACLHDLTSIVKLIIDKSPQLINVSNNHVNYPIHTALLNGGIEAVKLLLVQKGVCQQEDRHRQIALHHIAKRYDKALFSLCLKHTKDIDTKDNLGRTPLMYAAIKGNLEACQLLLKHGADITKSDHDKLSVEMLAKKASQQQIIDSFFA